MTYRTWTRSRRPATSSAIASTLGSGSRLMGCEWHPRGDVRAESAHDRCTVKLVRTERGGPATQSLALEPQHRYRQRLDLYELFRGRHRAPRGELHRTGSRRRVDGKGGAHARNLPPADAARHHRADERMTGVPEPVPPTLTHHPPNLP